jgi:hypothetical protein
VVAVSTVLAALFLILFLGTIIATYFGEERPIARCARCRRPFDSTVAHNLHVLTECDQ